VAVAGAERHVQTQSCVWPRRAVCAREARACGNRCSKRRRGAWRIRVACLGAVASSTGFSVSRVALVLLAPSGMIGAA